MTSRRAMGLHIQGGGANGAAAAYIRQARPSMVKWLAGTVSQETLAAAQEVGALTVLRIYEADQDLARFPEYLARIEQAMMAHPEAQVFEVSHNEAHQDPGLLAAKAAADILGMKLAERRGRKAAIGCFSVGMPDVDAWGLYSPALEYAAKGGHFLALHEYGGGSQGMRWGVTGEGRAARGWAFLRYRRVLDWAKRVGCPMPKILITEAGIDVIGQADRPTRGFRTMPEGYDYAADLRWASDRLTEDAEAVAGWCDFGWAADDPQWHPFDLSRSPDVLRRVAALQAALPEPAAPAPPKEAPVADLNAMLAAEFGEAYADLRSTLPTNPHGPNGDFTRRPLGNIDILAVHHTAGPNTQGWDAIAQTHIHGRGWAGIGYHIGIRQGRVSYLGSVDQARACCIDQNHRVLCVCLAGNFEAEPVAAADSEALRRVVGVIQRWSQQTLGRPLKVLGHKEVPGQATACPGRNLIPLVHQLAGAGPSPAPAASPGPNVLLTVDKAHRLNGITLNKDAALQRAIRADGLTPTTREMEVVDGGVTWICQRAEALAGGGATVYACRKGDWANVIKVAAS